MNILDVLWSALPELLHWSSIGWLMLGISIGLLFGTLPGIGNPQAMTLLIPLTFTLQADQAMLLFLGVMGAGTIGGSVTSILLGVPGTPINAATVIDGHPMAKQGRAGEALGAAVASSITGGVIGIAVLLVILQFGYRAVLAFSYPEFFMLAMAGILLMSVAGDGSAWKGLIAGGAGLLLATIGQDPMYAFPRFSAGSMYLWSGIKIVPVVIGLFALVEATELMTRRGTTYTISPDRFKLSGIGVGVRSIFTHFGVLVKGSVVGTFIGILPGVGGGLAQFMAYGLTVQGAKDKSRFGNGDIRGVIGPEASNNAKDGGSLVPTMVFGIPGSLDTAILLGALMMHGITPSMAILRDAPEVVVSIIVGVTLSTIIAGLITLAIAPQLLRILLIPPPIVAALVFSLALIGVYSADHAYGDVVMTLVFGVGGYLMKSTGFSRTTLIIGLLLGSIAEMNFRLGMESMQLAGFFARPITAVLVVVMLITIVSTFIMRLRRPQSR